MSVRKYNKIYSKSDRKEGSEKIILGYQNDLREISFKKDAETIFHVPFYTKILNLNDSNLIANGAVPGPFPAASDRIFKNLQNFGNYTPYGTPTDIAEGGWFCSWLYKDPEGNIKWMDRFYNPGKFLLSKATDELREGPPYLKHDPVFYDVPSKMTLESGVEYKYFHLGEKTASSLVDSFGGLNQERLSLDLTNWGETIVDKSTYKRNVVVNSKDNNLYSTLDLEDYVNSPILDLTKTTNTEVFVHYDASYNFKNEFTLAFWAFSENWQSIPSTQLAGNFSYRDGYGLFIDTLSSYPFFVVPETTYGHLLFVNEGLNGFLDKPVKLNQTETLSPKLVLVDSDNTVTTLAVRNEAAFIIKYNTAGLILNKESVVFDYTTNTTSFSSVTSTHILTETPLQLLPAKDEGFTLVTNSYIREYNRNLQLTKTTPYRVSDVTTNIIYNKPKTGAATTTLSTTDSNPLVVFALAKDSSFLNKGSVELRAVSNCIDAKFIEDTCWSIGTDGFLYKKIPSNQNRILVHKFKQATNLAIDPLNRVWVLHGTNLVTVLDSITDKQIFTFSVGEDITYASKNISFTCHYDPSTNLRTWKAVLYYATKAADSYSPQLFVCDLNGIVLSVLEIMSLFNLSIFNKLKHSKSKVEFLSRGDFTGYERKRIFNSLAPYNNEAQLILKLNVKDKQSEIKEVKLLTSIDNWAPNSWQHFILTGSNNSFKLYVNGLFKGEVSLAGLSSLNYNTRPSFYIGSSAGARYGLNTELAHFSNFFRGKFADIKIYNYAINPNLYYLFIRAFLKGQDLQWEMPTPNIQYVERIDRMFKNKIPGSKSPFFSINVKGLSSLDEQTKKIVEEELRILIQKTKPTYTNFLKINWID